MSKSLTVTFPIPSYKHSKNHRVHWKEKMHLWQDGRDVAIRLLQDQYPGQSGADEAIICTPFRMRILWKYYVYFKNKKDGQPYPDFDNAVARCSHFIDAMQHVRLIDNDNLWRGADYDWEEVDNPDDAEVILTIREIKKYAHV